MPDSWQRMKRRLLNFLTVASALLFVAVVVAWVRSYHVADALSRYRLSTSGEQVTRRVSALHWGRGAFAVSDLTTVMSTRGRDGRQRVPLWMRGDPKRGWYWEPTYPPQRAAAPAVWGGRRYGFFEYVRHSNTSASGDTRSDGRSVTVACWVPALLAAALPAVWVAGVPRRRRAALRRRLGLCARCGYDLRASAARCPECGAESPAASKTPAVVTATAR